MRRFRSGSAPHDVEVDPQHKTEELCASCHGAFGTISEFKQSKFAKQGQTCQSCHMPKVKRAVAVGGKERMVASHAWKGGDLEMLKRAVKMEASVMADGVVVVTIANVGAGHKFPTGVESHRAFIVVTLSDGSKFTTDTRVNPGEALDMKVATGMKSGTFVVQLLYKRTPSTPDKDALVVASRDLKL